VLDTLAQVVHAAPDPGFHGSERLAEVRGEVAMRHPVLIGEHQRLAFDGSQLAEAAAHECACTAGIKARFLAVIDVPVEQAIERGIRVIVERFVVAVDAGDVVGGHQVERAVAHDSGQPADGGAEWIELGRAVPDAHECVVQHLIGELTTPRDPNRNPEQDRGSAAVKALERGRAVGATGGDRKQ